jgi:hypothetical protein
MHAILCQLEGLKLGGLRLMLHVLSSCSQAYPSQIAGSPTGKQSKGAALSAARAGSQPARAHLVAVVVHHASACAAARADMRHNINSL